MLRRSCCALFGFNHAVICWYTGAKQGHIVLLKHDRLTTYSSKVFQKCKTDTKWECQEISRDSLYIELPLKEQYLPFFCGKVQTLHPSILCPFTPLASPWLPTHTQRVVMHGLRERVGQSRQREGSLKPNFTSEVQLHYEKINYPKGSLWLWLTESMNDAHHGYYFSLFFVLFTVTTQLRKLLCSCFSPGLNIFPFFWLERTMPSHFLASANFWQQERRKTHPLFHSLAVSTWQHLEKRVPLESCHPFPRAVILVLHSSHSPSSREGIDYPAERGQTKGRGGES